MISESQLRLTFNGVLANRFAKDGMFDMTQDPIKWTGRDVAQSITVALKDVDGGTWIQYGRSCRLTLQMKNGKTNKFDGFRSQDLPSFKKFFETEDNGIEIEEEEISAAGNNWGKFPVEDDQLMIKTMDAKIAFKVSLSVIAQCAVPKPNEIEIQFHNPPHLTKDDHFLSEMRIYVPPPIEGSTGDANAADKFQKKILQSSVVKTSGGQSIVDIEEAIGTFVTPRGKYAIEMHASHLRMHGKTYDYKINYQDLDKFFLLP
jgi:structure-specific recognition protein 1